MRGARGGSVGEPEGGVGGKSRPMLCGRVGSGRVGRRTRATRLAGRAARGRAGAQAGGRAGRPVAERAGGRAGG